MVERLHTIIIGGGQAGMATSYFLKQAGIEHIILEQSDCPAHVWRDDRWDSFTLATPNWATRLSGMEYNGSQPDAFMTRAELVNYFQQYATTFDLPIRYNVSVTAVEPIERGYRVQTTESALEADHVVMATGLFQKPRIPPVNIPASILQLPSNQYRNPEALPPGVVLVAGSAQSGCQIAEELYQSGRQVYLCTGTAGRAPRRYRGKDCYGWLETVGFFNRTVDKLPSPKAKFAGNPQISGKDGGHTLNLHQFARDGVTLLGRFQGAEDGKVFAAPDLHENLTKIDQFEANLVKMIDGYILQNGLDIPPEELPQLRDGYNSPVIQTLDLQAAGISTIIWACGYTFDYSLVKLPVVDADGFPIQNRGVTQYPGLYFVGMTWLHTQKSGLLLGVGEDAAFIASHIATS